MIVLKEFGTWEYSRTIILRQGEFESRQTHLWYDLILRDNPGKPYPYILVDKRGDFAKLVRSLF